MTSSVAASAQPVLENSLPKPVGSTSHAPGNSVPINLGALFRTAIDESTLADKSVALDMRIRANHFSEMLAGTRPFMWGRLEFAPLAVQRPFARLFAEARGWTVTDIDPLVEALADQQRATARVQMLIARRPQLKMEAR